MYSVAGFSRYIQFINVISVAGFSADTSINVLSPWLGWRYNYPPVQRPPSLTPPLTCLCIGCNVLFSLLCAYLCSRLSFTLYTSYPCFYFWFRARMYVVFTSSFCRQVPAFHSAKHFFPFSHTGKCNVIDVITVAGSWAGQKLM
jgi:hypothetical protein